MGNRISYRDVLRHRANGRSIREIEAACYCSSSAVQDTLARADERGVGCDDVAPLTDDDARRLVRGNPGKGAAAFTAIDYEHIDREMAGDRTMTLSILWEEYYASAVSREERPYLYSRFCELYAKHRRDAGVKGRRNHVPGDLGEFKGRLRPQRRPAPARVRASARAGEQARRLGERRPTLLPHGAHRGRRLPRAHRAGQALGEDS